MTEREEGVYLIKRVQELPEKGNSNFLYILKNDTINRFYRHLLNGSYEVIELGGSGGSRRTVDLGSFASFSALETFSGNNLDRLRNDDTDVTVATVTNGAVYEWGGANIPAMYTNQWFVRSSLDTITSAERGKLAAITGLGSGQIITPTERLNIADALDGATINGNDITFTRNSGTSPITITIPSTALPPGIIPTLPAGTLISLQSETFDASSGGFPSTITDTDGLSQIPTPIGALFRVTTAGTVDGQAFTTDDLLLAIASIPSSTTYASNWHRIGSSDGAGVHSWGGLMGIIDDRTIDTKIQSLNFSKGIVIQDEGSTVTGNAFSLNFVGNGVTASGTGDDKTITITDTDTNTQRTDEDIRDVVGTTLVAGNNVTIAVDDNANTITISAAGGGTIPTHPSPLYIEPIIDQQASSVDTGTALMSNTITGIFTIPTFTGNRYLGILSPESHAAYTQIIIGGINQIAAFTLTNNARTIAGQSYRFYVSDNQLVGSALSGQPLQLI